MKVLAFDQALVLGYCVLEGDINLSPPFITLIEVDSLSFKSKEMTVDKLLKMEEWIINKIKEVDPDEIVCENIHMNFGPLKYQVLSKILFTVERAAYLLDKKLTIYGPSEARATFGLAAKGNVKLDYVKWAKRFYDIEKQIVSHDACDALVLGTHHLYKISENEEEPVY